MNDLCPGFTPRAIFPAVSYWMVTTADADHDATRVHVMRRLYEACPRTELKLIKAQQRRPADTVTCLSGALYVVLKDHRSSYINRRVDRSLRVLDDVSEAIKPSRIVVVPGSKYQAHIVDVGRTLQAFSLSADVIVASDVHVDN